MLDKSVTSEAMRAAREPQLMALLKEICHNAYACSYQQNTFPGETDPCGRCANCMADKALGENWRESADRSFPGYREPDKDSADDVDKNWPWGDKLYDMDDWPGYDCCAREGCNHYRIEHDVRLGNTVYVAPGREEAAKQFENAHFIGCANAGCECTEFIESQTSAGVSPVSAKVERTGAEVLIRPQERGISAEPPGYREWISVEKELPAPNWYGLICTAEKAIEVAYFRRDAVGESTLDTFWQLERTDPCDETIRLEPEQVTHWMPLPEPPGSPNSPRVEASGYREMREALERALEVMEEVEQHECREFFTHTKKEMRKALEVSNGK